MALYNLIYDIQNYFGDPYPELLYFFENYQDKGNVLDIGCGQGRDAIALAQLGYNVHGIDNSEVGINQMTILAEKLNLKLKGEVADMFTYSIGYDTDIIILNSILHFLKDDKKKEVEFLKRILKELKYKGIICLCIWKSMQNETLIRKIVDASGFDWNILENKYIDYEFRDQKSEYKVKMVYNLLILQKL